MSSRDKAWRQPCISTKPCHTLLGVSGRTTLFPDFCSYFDWHASLPPICAAIHKHREGGCVRGRCGPTCRRRHRVIAARQSIRRDHSVAGRGRGGGCEKQRNGHRNKVALSASWQYERSFKVGNCCSLHVKARWCACVCVTLWAKRSDGAGLTLSSNMRCERPAAASAPSIVVCHRGVCAH